MKNSLFAAGVAFTLLLSCTCLAKQGAKAENKSKTVSKVASKPWPNIDEQTMIQIHVHDVELAMQVVETPRQFVEVMLEDNSSADRAFALKRIQSVPLVYRTGPTSLAFDDMVDVMNIDFRNAGRGELFVDGKLWILQPGRELREEWPIWERRYQQQRKKGDAYLRLNEIFESLLPEAFAQRKKQMGLGLKKMAELAAKKAEKNQKKLDWWEYGKGILFGAGFTTGAKLIDMLALDPAAKKACTDLDLETPNCVNMRVAVEAGLERLQKSEPLMGGKVEGDALRLQHLFTADEKEVFCRVRVPEDSMRVNLLLKRANIKVAASVKYDKDNKPTEGFIANPNNLNEKLYTYSFKDGALEKVCVVRTPDELAKQKAEMARSTTAQALSTSVGEECATADPKDAKSGLFSYHSNLLKFVDTKTADCGSKKVQKAEEKGKASGAGTADH